MKTHSVISRSVVMTGNVYCLQECGCTLHPGTFTGCGSEVVKWLGDRSPCFGHGRSAPSEHPFQRVHATVSY